MRGTSFRRSAVFLILGLALVFPQVVSAQPSDQDSGSLTVTGYGQASAPADTATVVFLVGSNDFSPPAAPDPDATPGAAERESIAPVVSTLVDIGVAETDIETIIAPYLSESLAYGGPAIARFRVELEDPTVERITEVVDAATVGAAQERLVISGVDVSYGVEDYCAALKRDARERAIADAREQAEVQADLLGITLGDLTGARDILYGDEPALGLYGPVSPTDGCAPFDLQAGSFVPYGIGTFDTNQAPTVTTYAQVELTFEMSPGPVATPVG